MRDLTPDLVTPHLRGIVVHQAAGEACGVGESAGQSMPLDRSAAGMHPTDRVRSLIYHHFHVPPPAHRVPRCALPRHLARRQARADLPRRIGSGLSFIITSMSRPLRIEFPGALYHVTSRGDRREPIYRDG